VLCLCLRVNVSVSFFLFLPFLSHIQAESTDKNVIIEQSQSDRSLTALLPVTLDVLSDGMCRVTVGCCAVADVGGAVGCGVVWETIGC
jgi:hypothetical protein